MASVTQGLVQLVQSSPMGTTLTSDERGAVQALNATLKSYPPHAVISRQGDVEPRLFVVNSGWGCIYRDLANGDRQIIDIPLKGDFVGILAAEGPNCNSFASITDLSIFEISKQAFVKTLDDLPKLSSFFMRLAARQHSIMTEHLTNAGRRNASVRTAHYLLELGVRLAAIGEGTELGYDCPLTQHELADVLGLTAIHVNRTLRELREHELVSFRSGVVEFINRQKLSTLSGFDNDYLRIR